jgi:DNA-binding CsgD family transcriptional regulator
MSATNREIVRSQDGTSIGYETGGVGDGLLVLGGAWRTSRDYLPFAHALAESFAVHVIDRHRLLLSLLRPHLNELHQELERRRRPVPDLTPRQRELLRLVASGHSNAEIARELVVSQDTVRKRLEKIFARLDLTNPHRRHRTGVPRSAVLAGVLVVCSA